MDDAALPDSTVSRAFKREARAKAGIQVDQQVKELEKELSKLSQANSSLAFVTTSGMF